MDSIFFSLDRSTSLIYLLLLVAAAIIPFIPIVKSLIQHGKTRRWTATRGLAATHNNPETALSAALNRAVVPKHYFAHFYAVGLVSLLSWRGYERFYHHSQAVSTTIVEVLLVCHLLRRLLECLFIHQWRAGSHMHVAVYLVGIAHYLWLPFAFFPYPKENLSNGKHNNTEWTEFWSAGNSFTDALFSRTFSLVLFCVWAQFQQFRHHLILANLRSPRNSRNLGFANCTSTAPSVDRTEPGAKYGLPQGGWFQYVSCPHYTAEILMYVGLVSCHCLHNNAHFETYGFRSAVLLLWVVTNLVINGLQSHQWYLRNIPSYGQLDRHAIIPFLV